jgi:hypothetical protein
VRESDLGPGITTLTPKIKKNKTFFTFKKIRLPGVNSFLNFEETFSGRSYDYKTLRRGGGK